MTGIITAIGAVASLIGAAIDLAATLHHQPRPRRDDEHDPPLADGDAKS